MKQAIDNFRSTVQNAYSRLIELSDEAAAAQLVPGKWSPKQIIGHLIDSVSIASDGRG